MGDSFNISFRHGCCCISATSSLGFPQDFELLVETVFIALSPPSAVYAVQPNGNESEERLPFPEEIDIIRSANSIPQPVVCKQFVEDGNVSEMLLDH